MTRFFKLSPRSSFGESFYLYLFVLLNIIGPTKSKIKYIKKGDDFLMDADPAYFTKLLIFDVEGYPFTYKRILP